MKKLYGLQTDKENVTLSVNEDKAMLTIQTADAIKVRELELQSNIKLGEPLSFEKVELVNIDANKITAGGTELEIKDKWANIDSKVEITEDGIKTSSANKESQPYPVQRALKRIQELKYITDVGKDEEFETAVDHFPENRLIITIDYLDVDFVKEARKANKYKLE